MGIKGLYKLLQKYAPGAITSVDLDYFSGWKIGIDASIAIHQWWSIGVSRDIMGPAGQPIHHIQGALFRTLMMLEAGIIPIYIFDGPAPKIKTKKVGRIPRPTYEEVAEIVAALGVGVMKAPSEAEAQAAVMTRAGSLHAVATEDMDALAFGAKFIIRKINTGPILISLDLVLAELGLTSSQFIDLCVLMGSDYTGPTGFGPEKALALIKQYGSIDRVPYTLPAGWQAARAEFMKPNVSLAQVHIRLRRPNLSKLARLIACLDPKRQESALARVKKIETGVAKVSDSAALTL